MDDVDCRRLDRDGDGSRELGLLWGCSAMGSNGDKDRPGVDGARLLEAEGERGREAVL